MLRLPSGIKGRCERPSFTGYYFDPERKLSGERVTAINIAIEEEIFCPSDRECLLGLGMAIGNGIVNKPPKKSSQNAMSKVQKSTHAKCPVPMLIRKETIPQKANQQYSTCWRDKQTLPDIDSKEPTLTVQFVYKPK